MLNKKAKLAGNLYSKNIKQAPTRNGYGEGLVEAGKKDKNVMVLCCDLTESTKSIDFKKTFPERFIEMGIMEQNMAAVSAGLALSGKVPFTSSYAMFSPGRAWEQIRTVICYNDANVKIAGAHSGVSVGPDGATHQAIEDIAITRVIPNMTIVVPCDAVEARKATVATAQTKHPCYLRFTREKTPLFTTNATPFRIGRAEIFRDGNDVTVIACGPLVYQALLAARQLEKEKISVMVINNHTIKPLDKITLLRAAKKTGAVVTVEEHQKIGGLGGAIAELLSENYPVPVKRVGVDDRFGESGPPEVLLEKFGLTAPSIIKAVKQAIKLK